MYFFKGDSVAHHKGLAAQREYLTTLDGYIAEMFEAAGGPEALLEEYAVLALSDHGHTPLLQNRRRYVDLGGILGEDTCVGARARFGPGVGVVAVPNGRSALLYLAEGAPVAERERVIGRVLSRRGVDLAAWSDDGWGVVRRLGRELRFRPVGGDGGGALRDPAGRAWELDGDPLALEIKVYGGGLSYGGYPDALERLWGCLRSERCGDVVFSASPGYTFGEVSRRFHAESDHGSLHASDSNVFVLAAGFPEGMRTPRRLTDVVPAMLAHFGGATLTAGTVGPRVP